MGNPLSAGLPQQAASGFSPVGSFQIFPDLGSIIRLADGSEWLRTGLSVPFATKYAQCAKLEYAKVYGSLIASALPVSIGTATAGQVEIASNGAGTIVIAYGSTSQVLVSTNGGQSFSTNAVSLGGFAITGVIWAGNRFIIWGYSSGSGNASFYLAHSATGTSWTAGSQLATLTVTSGDVFLAEANRTTGVVCFSAPNQAGGLWRCTAGSTVSQIASSGNAGNGLCGLACDQAGGGAGKWVRASQQGQANYAYSTDDGASWTATFASPSTITQNHITYCGGQWLWQNMGVTGGAYWATSTPSVATSWVSRTMPQASALNPGGGIGNNLTLFRWNNHDGTVRLGGANAGVGPRNIYETNDGLLWSVRQVSDIPPTGNNGYWRPVPDGAGGLTCVAIANGASASPNVLRTGPLSGLPSYVGTSNEVGTDTTSSSSRGISYLRIK
jgi:hypothetical protein